jgi:hypothetical protein
VFGLFPRDVEPADELHYREGRDYNIDIHHVPQAGPTEVSLPGYSRGSGPAITVPREIHWDMPTLPAVPMDPKALITKGLADLRKAGAPCVRSEN